MKSVIITNPQKEDIPFLKSFWKEIFKDDDDYINLFFSVKFKMENAFVIKEDGKIVSMLYGEHTTLINGDEELSGIYISGIATKEDKRGKGYAKMLIEEIVNAFPKTDVFYLIPAGEHLYKYYENLGFFPVTKLKNVEIGGEAYIEDYNSEFSYEILNGFYENMENSLYVKRSKEDFNAIYNCYKNFLTFKDGYIVYYTENEYLKIVEYTVPFEKAMGVGQYLINDKGLKGGYILKRYEGMPFAFAKTKKELKKEKSYINLMLN